MKIGIDVRTACQPTFGKGVYTWNIVREILALDKKNTYFLYANAITGNLASFAAHPSIHLKVIAGNPLLWHFKVMKHFKRSGGDLFFAPTSFIIPAFLTKKIPSVIMVHDLVSFRFPAIHETKAMILENLFLRKALRKTKHVIVPSENTKQDLIKLFHYPPEKISVIPHGIDERFFESPKNLEDVRKKYNLPEQFILTVSGLEPRKNVGGLIDAIFLSFPRKRESIDAVPDSDRGSPIKSGMTMTKSGMTMTKSGMTEMALIIVGGRGFQSQKTQKKIKEAGERILWIENCSPDELSAFYRLAKVFIYPSLYEGFGFPPLEAMASGCPVICSNSSSLPEVCGDAAILVNPKNAEEMSGALKRVLDDENLQKSLAEKGLHQAKNFSWKLAAEKTINSISATAQSTREND